MLPLSSGWHSLTHTHTLSITILRWSQYSNFKLLQVFLQHGSNDYFLSCRCCHSGTCPSHFSTFAVFGVRHRTCNVCIFNDHLWLRVLWLCHIFPWHRFNELFPENDPVAPWVVLYIKLVIDTNDFTLRRPTFVETEYSHQLPANLLPPNYHHRTQHPTTTSTSSTTQHDSEWVYLSSLWLSRLSLVISGVVLMINHIPATTQALSQGQLRTVANPIVLYSIIDHIRTTSGPIVLDSIIDHIRTTSGLHQIRIREYYVQWPQGSHGYYANPIVLKVIIDHVV